MSVITYTSTSRPIRSMGTEYAPCCGLPPKKETWDKPRSWRDMMLLSCQNPACRCNEGVLACDVDMAKKWEKYRYPYAALPLHANCYDA